MAGILHAFSIDVEDWYQSSYNPAAPVSKICVHNTRSVLDFLSRHNVRGTFFVQGLVARKYPCLVREIHRKGHEIQSHGYSHRPVYLMTSKEFSRELTETGKRLEDITGKPVTGFRAPDFSINRKCFWAFDVMRQCGIKYDSSVFPLRTTRYGIRGFERGYSIIRTASGPIEELPVSVLEFAWPGQVRIPIGGGGYFRLFPAWVLRCGLLKLERQGLPFIIYCHPYEFNSQEWRQISKHVPRYRRLHQGLGRKGFQEKVAQLFILRRFASMSDVLDQLRSSKGRKVCAFYS